MKQRRPTIVDVARHVGVSTSLVSLVIRGSGRVSAERRADILRAIDELGYVPSAAARQLAAHRTATVGVVFANLRNPWHADFLDGLEEMLRQQGMRTMLGDANRDADRLDGILSGFEEFRIEALVCVGQMPDSSRLAALAARVPVVVVGMREQRVPRADVFGNDDTEGARMATEHLLSLGHRRIAHVSGDSAVATLRRESFEATLAQRGLAPCGIEVCDLSEEGGYRATVRLLSQPERPTAIFAIDDVVGIGALSAIDELGLRCPEDVSVIGYGNTSLARTRHIGLTSVDVRAAETGRRVGLRLQRRLRDEDDVVEGLLDLLRPELVPRRTTAPFQP